MTTTLKKRKCSRRLKCDDVKVFVSSLFSLFCRLAAHTSHARSRPSNFTGTLFITANVLPRTRKTNEEP